MKLLALILLISLFTGCATFQRMSPEDRASDLGVVMDCKDVWKGGKPYRKCQVLTNSGMGSVSYKVCN